MLDLVGNSEDRFSRDTASNPKLIMFFFQNMDIGEYEPFLAIGFSTPPVDQDIPPTFGTLLSCVSVCMRLLMKVSYNTIRRVMSHSWQ